MCEIRGDNSSKEAQTRGPVAKCAENVLNAAKGALVLLPSPTKGTPQRTKSDPQGLPLGNARNMLHYASGNLPGERAQDAQLFPAEDKEATTTVSRDLGTLVALLSTTLTGEDCTLAGHTIKPPKFSSRGSAIWRSTPMWPQQAAVTGNGAADGLYTLDPCSTMIHDVASPWAKAKMMVGVPCKASETVCTMTGAGTQLRDGELQLSGGDLGGAAGASADTALVLDSSCSAVTFRNMKFTGGQIVCHGTNCTPKFSGVTFERCTLVAMAGAQVTLERPTFKSMGKSSSGLSIYVHGVSTKVVSEGGCISGGTQAVVVQAGGHLEAADLTVTDVDVTGMEVQHSGSAIKLNNCTLHDFSDRYNAHQLARALHVHSGGSCKLTAVTVSGTQWGVDVRNSDSKAVLSECSVSDCVCACVLVREQGAARLVGCTLARSCMRQGLYVVGAGSSAAATRCQLLQNARFGAAAIDGGRLTAQSCESSRNKMSGFLSQGVGSVVELSSCASDNDQKGCEVNRGGRLTAHKVWVSCSGLSGFGVFSEGQAVLRDCVAKECGLQGLYVKGEGSRADVARCQFVQNMYSGAVAFSGGELITDECTDTEMHGSNKLAGQYSSGGTGGEGAGELVGLHVRCRSGNACAICQASEGGDMATSDAGDTNDKTGDAGMFVEALQAMMKANDDPHVMSPYFQEGDEDETLLSDDSESLALL